jgi:arylsulfatase A-like enzyme
LLSLLKACPSIIEYRGGKYSLFEGGCRVPTVARWPGRIKPGQTSDAMISQVDFPRSFAKIADKEAPASAFPDSQDITAALLGESPTGRDHVILHAKGLALREGKWKFIPAGKGQATDKNTATETGVAPQGRLYDLSQDPGETINLAAKNPEVMKRLSARLEAIRETPEKQGP